MYYCRECDSFIEGKVVSGGYESVDPPYLVCEICGSDDLEDANRCQACGDYYPTYQEGSSIDYCQNCIEFARDRYSALVDNIASEFNFKRNEAIDLIQSFIEED